MNSPVMQSARVSKQCLRPIYSFCLRQSVKTSRESNVLFSTHPLPLLFAVKQCPELQPGRMETSAIWSEDPSAASSAQTQCPYFSIPLKSQRKSVIFQSNFREGPNPLRPSRSKLARLCRALDIMTVFLMGCSYISFSRAQRIFTWSFKKRGLNPVTSWTSTSTLPPHRPNYNR